MNKLTLLLKFLVNRDYRDYRQVRTFQVFDPDYFAQQVQRLYPESYELLTDADDPLWSYFLIARNERIELKVDSNGWHQLCDPHPLFDSCFYLSRYHRQVGSRNPFAHYLLRGWMQGYHPGPFFDPEHYGRQCAWTKAEGNPLTHWVKSGMDAAISTAPSFDRDWYLDQAPYPAGVRTNAVKHYKLFGARSGKSPVPVFCPHYYLDNVDDQGAQIDPFLHYICSGESEGIWASRSFDGAYYKKRYLDELQNESALLSYLGGGIHEKPETNAAIAGLVKKPVISVIVPVFNPDLRYLRNCIRSVLYQSYPYWELCLVDDCSADESIRDELRSWAAADSRVKCLFIPENLGISGATQAGVEAAEGEYVGFLDNDDELAEDCLLSYAREIVNTGGQIFYSDEDLVGDDGSRHAPFYKPAFNKALLYSHNYITHFVVVLRSLFFEIGGFSAEFDGAQDYDLMLKLADSGHDIRHIPEILYHWRAVETSTSIAHEQKPYAHEAGKRALEMSLQRNELAGRVTDGPVNFHYRIELPETLQPPVTVIVGGSDSDLVAAKTAYKAVRYCCTGREENGYSNDRSGRHPQQKGGSLAQTIQGLIEQSSDDYIAILGHGASDVSGNWLNELVSKMRFDKDIEIVCGRICFDGTDGVSLAVPDLERSDAHYYTRFIGSASTHANGLHNMQWVNACDWTMCLISRKLIEQIGGFDYQRFPHLLSMVELCYRASAAANRILYTPDAVVTLSEQRAESPFRTEDLNQERALFSSLYHEQIMQYETFYNFGGIADAGYDRESFFRWLSSAEGKQSLTEPAN